MSEETRKVFKKDSQGLTMVTYQQVRRSVSRVAKLWCCVVLVPYLVALGGLVIFEICQERGGKAGSHRLSQKKARRGERELGLGWVMRNITHLGVLAVPEEQQGDLSLGLIREIHGGAFQGGHWDGHQPE